MRRENDSSIFKFTRKHIICNKNPNDFSIDMTVDEMNIIYMWGDSFMDSDIDYTDSNSGSRVVEFDKELVDDDEC